MNYTNIEQCKKLLELGLGSETADMYWMNASIKNVKIPQSPLIIDNDFHKLIDDFDVPCWSVGTLLNLMPVVIINMDGDNFLRVEKNNYSWSIFYADNFNGNVEYIIKKPELIDACYEMMVWLLENNHIKK